MLLADQSINQSINQNKSYIAPCGKVSGSESEAHDDIFVYFYGRPALAHRERGDHYILRMFRLFLSFFLSPHFLRHRKTDIPETFPHDMLRWFSPQQDLCYTDFFEVPPKTNGNVKG